MSDISSQKRSLEVNETDSNDSFEKKKFCAHDAGLSFASENEEKESSTTAISKTPMETFNKATENDVGITEFVSSFPGFPAVMKERYSDFLVNEIDLQGNIVRLTNMEIPMTAHNFCNINDLLEEEILKNLSALVEDKECNEVKIEVSDKDKNLRKQIHEAVRQNFQGLESSTVEKENGKFIIVKKQDAKSKNRRFQPSSAGNYIHFVMYKENRDTMDAINTISSFLRIQSKAFSYAGTKDKRGKTSQRVSVYRLSPERLLNINRKFNMIKVGNIVFKNDQLKLGDLMGNNFIIILRQLKGCSELVEKAVNSLATSGFINYYGMQRFGTSSISTHSIGRALLLGDWKKAIDLILKPRLEGDENLASSRKIWVETKDAKRAYENLKHKSCIEGKLLSGLASNKENDLVNALNAIPRNTRLMYIHSYQSFIWNQVVSERIKKYGLKVLPGDLVSDASDGLQEDLSAAEKLDFSKKLNNCVRYITEDEIDSFKITDVLLPLSGHSVKYPNNEIKDYYERYLKEDGMNWNSFESKVKTYSLSGTYRRMIIIPKNVKWEIVSYNDVSKPLALSDLDILHGVTLPDANKDLPEDGTHKALKMEFKLPSSSYATMAIREVLKCNTSYSSKKTYEE